MLLLALTSFSVLGSFDIAIHLQHRNGAALEDAFWAIATPGTDSYLDFMSVEQIATMVGAEDAVLSSVDEHLEALGARSVRVSSLRDVVTGTFDDAADTSTWARSASGRAIPRAPAHLRDAIHTIVRNDKAVQQRRSRQRRSRQLNASAPDALYTIANTKKAYGIPVDLAASNPATLQMVWGPGTFGYSKANLLEHKLTQCPLLNMSKIAFDTAAHGTVGGDNFGEGNLDVSMITSFGLNVETTVSNTNTSSSTEEGDGFGLAMLHFVTELAARATVPQVLSLSLGSLSAFSCDLLCSEAEKAGVREKDCTTFLQSQRQVCMFISQSQVDRINDALKVLGARGVTVFGSSGDGGSHWSFDPFPSGGRVADALNKVGCEFQFPVFPTTSPYVVSVGGSQWSKDPSLPMAWDSGRGGGGFSWSFPAPAHQADAVKSYLTARASTLPASTSFNSTGRAFPDISALAIDGTSQSSPTMAGIFSMIIDMRLNAGLKPLGPLGPRLWRTSAKSPGVAFENIEHEGDNTKTSCATGFPNGPAWDPVTGWGRPVWDGLKLLYGSDASL